MKKAPKLTDAERSEIGILLSKAYSHRSIAAALERSPNTVSDEIRRNSVRGQYVVASAKRKSYLKRKYAKYQGKKIQEHKELREYVISGLKAHWNPDEISGSMKQDKLPFYASKTTISGGYIRNGVRLTVSICTRAGPDQRSANPRPKNI